MRNGTDRSIWFTGSAFYASNPNAVDLGYSTCHWKNIYAQTLQNVSGSSYGKVTVSAAATNKAVLQASNGTYSPQIQINPGSRKIQFNIDSGFGQVLPAHSNVYDFGTSSYYWSDVWCKTINWDISNEWDHLDDIQIIKDMRSAKDRNGRDIINEFGGTIVDPDSIPDAFTNKLSMAKNFSRESGLDITQANLEAIRSGEKVIKWKEKTTELVYNSVTGKDEPVEKETEMIIDAAEIKRQTFFNGRHMTELAIGAIKQLTTRIEALEERQ